MVATLSVGEGARLDDQRAAFDVLAYALTRCYEDRVTGTLRIVGNAGGLFHLRDGVVIAVESSGSPGVETLLLSSGRVSAEDWTAALVESVETRCLQSALVARGTVGSAEVQLVAMAAIQDGAFAAAAGDVERYVVGESADVPLLPASGGVTPELLLSETARRLDAVASLPFPVSPYRDRVVPTGGAESAAVAAEWREIIAQATGRRNARDIAFVVGRSLYSVTVEISRMLGEGLLEIASPAASFSIEHWGLTALRSRAETGPV
ncbi:hypothetical protein Lesp02_31210 [Lentzea sp. NBRC 105346]|uniref:hypothetical protein n=1 Tax=Lentzea sp. NBRC 105346 TaxID=3032205 RepID=UPI0024A5704E|nr:hypothetical protein [Lentzea sp. NBRC 105346]GLZ30932.1 hypothetical protein Lesp02_31210 [Lentzea sp. NBRC 105346]